MRLTRRGVDEIHQCIIHCVWVDIHALHRTASHLSPAQHEEKCQQTCMLSACTFSFALAKAGLHLLQVSAVGKKHAHCDFCTNSHL